MLRFATHKTTGLNYLGKFYMYLHINRNCWGCSVLDSIALTKIQSVTLITIVVVAAVAGSAAYMLWLAPAQSTENIRIGVVGDLDHASGRSTLRGAILAAEQINAEGGILGRNITIISEDDDSSTPPNDIAIALNALTKLITIDKADYIISSATGSTIITPSQDIAAEHKKIMFSTTSSIDNYTQRVLDNYEKYKYCFRVSPPNASTISAGMLGDILTVVKYTGFTKVALLFQDNTGAKQTLSILTKTLPTKGVQIVYNNLLTPTTTDFTSYFAAIEAAGAEILFPYVVGSQRIPFVKEWYERQSPFVVWGVLSGDSDFWDLTDGKVDTVSCAEAPTVSGYPLTNKTLPTREAYIQRWGEVPGQPSVGAYDLVRFILPDAIKRAGTTETEAVIKTLESTNVETSSARHFVFTSSHDIMVGSDTPNNPAEDYYLVMIFQWQNGTRVPVKPEGIMKEAGVSYKYPSWSGPWDNKQTP
jgi:branched-chain amino acid transport system substrate-binding protein